MIRLITGLPGAGKSLRAVWLVRQYLANGEGRPVYAHGIDGLDASLGAQECDPRRWEELPDGSIIVVDEAQKVWPTRRMGDVPPDIRALSEHRHRGFDFVLLTQHPTMLDAYIRKLVGEHCHLVRQYGMQASRVITWSEAQDDPQSLGTRQRGTDGLWRFPRECFGHYKSATMHTVKRRVPLRLKVLPVLGVLAAVLGWVGVRALSGLGDVDASAVTAPIAGSLGVAGPQAPPRRAAFSVGKYADAAEYAAYMTPRVAGLPWSAPVFDQQAVQAEPEILCVMSEAKGCRCYTEQITRLEVPILDCVRIARDGAYNPHRRPLGRDKSAVPESAAMRAEPASRYESLPVPPPDPRLLPVPTPAGVVARHPWIDG